MSLSIRMIAPSRTSGRNPITVRPANAATGDPGYTIDVAAYAVVDVEPQFAGFLESNGWMKLGAVGTTAQRPLPGSPQAGATITAQHGTRYLDLDLSKIVTFDSRQGLWLDYTGAAV
jgi:hypothetical protein